MSDEEIANELEEIKKELEAYEKEKLRLWSLKGMPVSLQRFLILYETVRNPLEKKARDRGKTGKEFPKGLPKKRIKELCKCSNFEAILLNRALKILLLIDRAQALREKAIRIQLIDKEILKEEKE